jgi:hypothetical protein
MIKNIVEKNMFIFNSSYVLKINKAASFLTFILKEIYDYLNLKLKDGTLLICMRKQKHESKKSKEKMNI